MHVRSILLPTFAEDSFNLMNNLTNLHHLKIVDEVMLEGHLLIHFTGDHCEGNFDVNCSSALPFYQLIATNIMLIPIFSSDIYS